jgi:dipeptidase D
MQKNIFSELSPNAIWDIFYDITQIPRPSKKEEKFVEYLKDICEKNGLKYKVDNALNFYAYKPATAGYENKDALIIQNHMDMVTDMSPDYDIDFEKDPIIPYIEEGFVKAKNTTLGADNGIGCAAAIALLISKDLKHPKLEILFTSDEETGLNGAMNIVPEYLTGTKLINLDTEEWGSVYIGCAGGTNIDLTKEYPVSSIDKNSIFLKLDIKELGGGHSGIDIHRQRGNGIKILNFLLATLSAEFKFSLININGGRAHNIIPNKAELIIALDSQVDISKITNLLNKNFERYKNILPTEDIKVKFTVSALNENSFSKGLSTDDTKSLIGLISLFPHGVLGRDFNTNYEIVSSSINLAKLFLNEQGQIAILASARFFDKIELDMVLENIKTLASNYNFSFDTNIGYPSWKPNKESKLLELVSLKYQEIYSKKPFVTAIHAGLECGLLLEKLPNVEAISFGPNIYGAHSIEERVEIESVQKFWDFFVEVVEGL